MRYRIATACLLPVLLLACDAASGQIVVIGSGRGPRQPVRQYRIEKVDVNATIKDQAAEVQMAQVFENQSSFTIEAQFLFPLPEGAAISNLTLIVDGKELTGELRKREEARQVYESIVRQQKDPALLEYIGNGVFKTSVFPIPAKQKRRVEIKYTQLLKNDNGLVDFTLPLGTVKHTQRPINTTSIKVNIATTEPIKTVYSPTHEFKIERPDEDRARCSLTLENVVRPNDVRLLFGVKNGDVGMNLISYRPDADKDGYFLLLASPRVKARKKQVLPKTVLFVVDRSGSMAGEKIDQAKASLKYMIQALGEKDTFNVISYSSDVNLFREELEIVSSETKKSALAFVEDLVAGGGTNINDALAAALQQLHDRSRPCYVMFLTDGLPTVGVKDEKQIATNTKKLNEYGSRIVSFGVGYDVNSRLLDRLSRDNRGTSVYVKPTEDIEVATGSVFQKVSSPVMTDVTVAIVPEKHDSDRKAIKQVYPREVTDLFRGEQLVMVGRYRTPGPTQVKITGKAAGKERTFELKAKLAKKSGTSTNSYVEKIWATRRIGEIIDELDLNGRNQELVDELVALSLKHGIMTPYTAFLAEEDVRLADRANVFRAGRQLDSLSVVSGESAFRQRQAKQQLIRGGSSAGSPTPGLPSGGGGIVSGFGGGGGGGLGGGGQAGMGAGRSYSNRSKPGSSVRGGGRGRATNAPAKGLPKTQAGEFADEEEADRTVARRERVRRIGSKTFYWKKDIWVDSELGNDKAKDMKVVEIEQFSDAYFKLATRDKGKFSRFLSLKEPVEVLLNGTRYRIVPAKEKAEAKEETTKEKS